VLLLLLLQVLLQVLVQVLVQVLLQVQVQVPIEKRMSDFCPLTCDRRGNGAPRGGEGARMRRRARTQSGAARGGAGEGGRGGIPRTNCPFLRDSTTGLPPISTCAGLVVEVCGVTENPL
jgi:hypothetical protein